MNSWLLSHNSLNSCLMNCVSIKLRSLLKTDCRWWSVCCWVSRWQINIQYCLLLLCGENRGNWDVFYIDLLAILCRWIQKIVVNLHMLIVYVACFSCSKLLWLHKKRKCCKQTEGSWQLSESLQDKRDEKSEDYCHLPQVIKGVLRMELSVKKIPQYL